MGKKGSGKSTLTKELILQTGGKVLYFSPVESLKIYDFEVWNFSDLKNYFLIENMKIGDIGIIRDVSVEAMDICCTIAILNENYTFVIDEIDMYNDSKVLETLIHYGRHSSCNIICNTRRYTDIPRLLTSQSDFFYCFQISEPSDSEYLRKLTSNEYQQIVKSLGQYQYCIYPSYETHQSKISLL